MAEYKWGVDSDMVFLILGLISLCVVFVLVVFASFYFFCFVEKKCVKTVRPDNCMAFYVTMKYFEWVFWLFGTTNPYRVENYLPGGEFEKYASSLGKSTNSNKASDSDVDQNIRFIHLKEENVFNDTNVNDTKLDA